MKSDIQNKPKKLQNKIYQYDKDTSCIFIAI